MLGVLVILIISWLLLHFIEKESLLALGFLPLRRRSSQFGMGILFSAAICLVVLFIEKNLAHSQWVGNPEIDLSHLMNSFWWDTRSVVTEELVFRGALLYILIRRTSTKTAILISAASFGVYHWFSYEMWSNWVPMIFVFAGTAFSGYVWAMAFVKTKSILLPIGLHLGWNLVQNSIFSKGPLGEMLILSHNGSQLTGLVSLINYLITMIGVPIFTLIFLKYAFRDENKAPDRL